MVSKAKSCADHQVGEGYYILRYRNPGRTRLHCRNHFPLYRLHRRPYR